VLPVGGARAIEFRQQIVEQRLAFAPQQPRYVLARIEPERQRGAEGECRVLAPIVIKRGVAHLDRAVRHGVEHLQTGYDFAGSEGLDLETIVGDFGDAFAEIFAATV
jgi:hypothetical protein